MALVTDLLDMKIKLNNHAEFLEAWKLLVSMGYSAEKPKTCPYLYPKADGRILLDWFDVEGADHSDTSDPNRSGTALHYYQNHAAQAFTLDQLRAHAALVVFWKNAPSEAYAWERYPSSFSRGKCVWHCVDKYGESYTKKAKGFDTNRSTMWRDLDKQQQADITNASIHHNFKIVQDMANA